jgi:hypothetical protein
MKYVFDNCISYRLAEMLRALNEDVIHINSLMPVDTPDVELFEKIKHDGRVFVSLDRMQKTREREALAIKENRITGLWLSRFFCKKIFWEQAVWLVKHWKTIDGYVSGVEVGTCAEIKENGKSMPFTID